MKALLVCLVLAVLNVSANGGGGGGRGGSGAFGFPFSIRRGSCFERGSLGWCGCLAGRKNLCIGVTGTMVRGCAETNQFVQCDNGACSLKTCPDKQVWSKPLNACAECPTGMHVAANLQTCVCDKGTTLKDGSCQPCPKNSVENADSCACDTTTTRLDVRNNECKACPAGSILARPGRCQCSNTQFWNDKAWLCQDCPGQWLPPADPRRRQPAQVCTCSGTNVFFDVQNVRCFTCPSGTTFNRRFQGCDCPVAGQLFNLDTDKCECARGLVPTTGGAGCTKAATDSTTPVAVPGNP